jgi:hypothetical protein
MPSEQRPKSVGDLLGKHSSLAEVHLIMPAWSSRRVFGPKYDEPPRPS